MRRLFWALLLGVGAALAQVKNPGVMVSATIGDWSSFDPAWAYDSASWEVLQNTYETLVFYDGPRTDRFIPLLATQVPSRQNGLISADGLTYRFPIRKGVRFHDGTPLTAEDVVYSIRRVMVMDPDGGPAWLLLEPLLGVSSTRDAKGNLTVSFKDIERAVYAEGDTVVFRLKKPFAPFLSILATPVAAVVPKAWAVKLGEWDGTEATWKKYNNPKQEDSHLNDQINGTGPFALEQYVKGKQVVLKRFEGYWRKPAALERVVLMKVEEYNTRRLMLQNGDADFIDADRQYLPELKSLPGVMIQDGLPTLQIDAIFFTQKIATQANPYIGSGRLDGNGIPPDFFADKNIRKAFAYSFNYTTFLKEVLLGQGLQPTGVIPKGLLGYNPLLPKYTYSPEQAKRYFQLAQGGKVWQTGFKVTFVYNEGNNTRKAALEILKRGIEALNPRFKVEVRGVPFSKLIEDYNAGRLPVFMLGWLADYPDPHDFAQPFLYSEGNYPKPIGYKNPKVDELVEKAAQAQDARERERLYSQVQRLAYEDAPFILTDQPTGARVMRSWVKGWYYNPVYAGEYYYALSK